ncbi:MAG TPA: DUF4908 domain-containing protein [Rhizomicrobium sp.]|nr:DUF4908 domain-containing protein [Rhizomicrobium sp.]
MLRILTVLFCGAALMSAFSVAHSAEPREALEARLSSDRLGRIESGIYQAGDHISFALDSNGANYLLSFNGVPETFVLHPDSASMGGRVLKYDSGETALQVSGWGALTLYTDADPGGLPAVRTGDFIAPAWPPVSQDEIQNAEQEDASQLGAQDHLTVAFHADWAALAASGQAPAIALDALENVARGIERFCRSAHGHAAFARRVTAVTLAMAGRPTVTLEGKILFVTFNPDLGYEGRASSRSIAFALGMLLSAPKNQS